MLAGVLFQAARCRWKIKKAPAGGACIDFGAAPARLPSRSSCCSVNRPGALRANALLFWLRLRHDRRCQCLRLERVLEHFVESADIADLNVAADLRSEMRHDIRLRVDMQQAFRDPLPRPP